MVKNSEKICLPVTRTPHFFKVMLPDITTQHLRIPPEFMKYIFSEESDRAILEGPTGSQWHVKLCKTENGTYLQDGWREFVRDHSICHYEFLVFRYDGDMCFNVKIFDKSGYERDDAFTTKTQGLVFPIEKRFVSCVDKKRGRLRKKRAGSCHAGKRRGRSPKKCAGSADVFASRACQMGRGISEVAEKRIQTEDVSMPTCERDSQARHCLSRTPKTEGKEDRVRKATESFSSNHPFFLKCLEWYNVARTFVLHIPAGFCKAHLRCLKKVILQTSRGKDWIVNLRCSRQYIFAGGWTAFARDNKLEKGDICIFELVSKSKFRVHIFPVVTL